ncbi:ABC transporter ATP-binding protein [Paenibacillus radicis (ex Gao et al. 2016)]|uniref:Oligopeptide ABC transporter ATP-binding protein OppF n=1 Tax=Paenibacillus radicis (ex Gao et al. 2016) TaxID=1737354 RepID=A0A917H5N4_9BACL|nr:ABC transporter ATP-binding protein [Paenibacillus radicis (ex Gao et al. 2016)]GGG68113.1 oligopeptide ABC transporter ATP-binding protein OppF [Paenibacillus radicis (ex Gao et al. 2016)]
MNNVLDIEQLSVDFMTPQGPRNTVNDVNLTIAPGETLCLVGESGSGKTITSLSVMRLIEYDNGHITKGSVNLNGLNLAELSLGELRKLRGRKIAMIFQEPMTALDPVFTIGHQMMEILIHHGLAKKEEAWNRSVKLLDRVGIADAAMRMKQHPHELSGGMRQRVMIAMALACGPELLIADEPTTALDVTIQAQILQLLRELKAEFNMSLLLITHDLGVAAEMADRVAVMYAGKVVEVAEVGSLYAKPLHPYTRGLLQSITTLESDRSKPLHHIPGSIPSLADLPKGCRFHPRCAFATDRCRTEEPPAVRIDNGMVACWHADQMAELPLVNEERLHKPDKEAFAGLNQTDGNPEVLVEAINVTKHFSMNNGGFLARNKRSVYAVNGVSLQIYKGETIGLVGESGSGKSTLGRVLLQLEKATSGEIRWGEIDLVQAKPEQIKSLRREMQMVFQDPHSSVNSRWKVIDIIGEPLRVHLSLSAKERREKVEELMLLVGLDPSWANRYPHEFSGGQRQRIGIARAIALNPKFIVLDEAVSALDVSVQAQIINLLQDLQRRLGLTYLFIAHGLHVVRHLSDRVGVMYLGQLVELASTETLFASPAHPYTHALMSAIPNPDPARKKAYMPLQGEMPSQTHRASGCSFHPRCPAATEKCKAEAPVWRKIGAQHYVACHHPRV